MIRFRIFCYLVATGSLLIFFIPFPFQIPQILRDVYAGPVGILIGIVAFFGLVFSMLVLLGVVVFGVIKGNRNLQPGIGEFLFVTFLLTSFVITFASPYRRPPGDKIYELNKDKRPEQFLNPYATFEMFDCRGVSTDYDVVFIPNGLRVETEYLAYAPQRRIKTIDYKWGRKYGDDWYWDTTGSQWDPKLIECINRNLSPISNN
jgi:hypothetical protein